jgi:nucleoside-diphosphate-sugar epimerase
MVRLLLSVVKQLAGVEGSFQTAPWPDDWRKVDVGDYVGDYTKLNEATKWNPRVGLEEGLERTVRFYMRYGEFYGLKKGGSQRSI